MNHEIYSKKALMVIWNNLVNNIIDEKTKARQIC